MILVIDNYDSFTYNLVQLFQQLGQSVTVHLNDRITPEEVTQLAPKAVLLSPGPCTPAESGVCPRLVRAVHRQIPILGVCLGHQVIGEVFGASVERASRIMHGKTDTLRHTGDPLFRGVPEAFTAARYHSLAVKRLEAAPELMPLAFSGTDGTLMALRHRKYPVYGLQFHPESFASQYGQTIAGNFLSIASAHGQGAARRYREWSGAPAE